MFTLSLNSQWSIMLNVYQHVNKRFQNHKKNETKISRRGQRFVRTVRSPILQSIQVDRRGCLCPRALQVRYIGVTVNAICEIHGACLPSPTPFHALLPTFITKGSLRMGRLHRLSFLSVLIGPAFGQITYPNCSAGWEWVSISRILYISPLRSFPIVTQSRSQVVQHLGSKPVQRRRIPRGLVQWWT